MLSGCSRVNTSRSAAGVSYKKNMPSASGSLPFVRSASPFVRLETTAALGQLYANIRADVRPEEESNVDAPTQEGRETPNQEGRESRSSISEADLLSCRSYCSHSEARSHSTTCRPSFVSPRSTDYCCAICIELLLRPVVLSCGHRLCRGCWVRVLQGSQARAIASRTGSAACPLGRCEVRPCVPEVDQDLESKMRSRLGFKQLATHAATAELAPLDEESAAAAAVNAWAAAGCKLDQPDEIEAARREVVARTAAEAAAAAATNATMDDSHLAVAPRRCNFHAASILLSISLTLFFAFLCFNDGAKARDLSPCTTPANYNQPLPVTCATATHPHLCRYSAAAHPPSRALCIPHGTRRGITRSLHTRFSTPCVAQNYATWEKVWVWSLFASSACLGFILLLFDTKDMTRVLLSLRRRGSAVGGIFSSSRTAPVEAAEPV